MTTQTPADELRTAAIAIRCKANAATPGPWRAGGEWMRPWELTLATTYPLVEMASNAQGAADAEHIASWYPAVALAVADWLDGCAALSDMTDANYADGGNGQPTGRHWALAVARAYLGATEQVTA